LTVMMDCLCNEIMILGFIGLCVYCATKTDLALALARHLYPHSAKLTESDDPLAETFETVHMVIFCVMVCFISQVSLLMYKAVYLNSKKWTIWEHVQVGKLEMAAPVSETSLTETCNIQELASNVKGHMTHVSSMTMNLRKSTMNIVKVTEAPDAGDSLATMLQEAGYGAPEFKPVLLERNPWKRMFTRGGVLDLLQWRLLRHSFMFPPSPETNGGDEKDMVQDDSTDNYRPKEPQFCHFAEYLDKKMGEAFVELIEVDFVTWGLCMVVALFMPKVVDLGPDWYTTVAAIASWSIVGCFFLFGVHIHDVYNRLTPELEKDADARKYVSSMKGTSATALKRAAKLNNLRTPRLSLDEGGLDAPFLGTNDRSPGECTVESFVDMRASTSSLSKRFIKRDVRGNAGRPWYLMQMQRCGLIKLDKPAPNDHDRMFFFHEASRDIYIHLIGDLLFFQSVIASMYLVMYCISAVELSMYQTVVAILGLCGPALNLFYLVPKVVGKTVMVFSIEHMKDRRAIEETILETKKMQLIESIKILELARMEGKVERILQEDQEEKQKECLRRSQESSAMGPAVATTSGPATYSEGTRQKYQKIFDDEFSEKKKKDIRHMFQMFDADQSGSIGLDEMFAVLQSMHVELTDSTVQSATKLWGLVDADHSGEIEWEEFRVLMAMVLSKPDDPEEDCKALFQKFDEDGSGEITIAELASGFAKLGVSLDDDSIAALVGQVFHKSRQSMDEKDFIFFMDGLEGLGEKD